MKRFLFCLNILLCCTCVSYAQLDLLNISDYERPFIQRQTLILNLGSNGSNNFGEGSFSTFSEITRTALSGEGRITYSNYRNSQKYQGTHRAFTRFAGSSDKTTYPSTSNPSINSVETNKAQNIYIDVSSTNYFYTKKNYFLLGGFDGYYNNNHSKETQEFSGVPDLETESTHKYTRTSLEVGIGKGRIDPIGDVYLAIYLIEQLQRNNRLAKDLSPEETLSFAQHIAQVKNRRVLDFRLKRIYEMEAIDSFFVENQLITEADATYFTTLADLVLFGYFPDRNKGSLISLSFIPEYNISNINTPISLYEQKNYNLLGKINYRYYRPIKLKYLWTVDASIVGGKKNLESNYTLINFSEPNTVNTQGSITTLISSIQTSLSYFPNTRTEIKGSIQAAHFIEDFSGSSYISPVVLNDYQTNFSTNLQAFYWFSPRLNIQADYRYTVYRLNYDPFPTISGANTYRRNMTGSLSLNYSFF